MTLKRLGMIAVIFALVSVLALTTGTSVAQAQCAKTSSVNMLNLEDSTANIVITAYNSDGSVNGQPFDGTIDAKSPRVFFPIPNIEAGFSGSLVVSSNRDVAAIANIVCSNFSAGGSYNAGTGGSASIKLPLLMKNNGGFDSQFSVQNAGSTDAVVTVTYSDGTSAPAATIKSGAAKVYDQRTESHSEKAFAATVTSDGEPILAAALHESSDVINAYTAAIGSGDTNPVFPLVNANNNGILTGIQIQNVGSQATDVTVTYTPSSAGEKCTETQTIPGNGSNSFAFLAFFSNNPPAGISTDCAAKDKFVGSAEVTANSAGQPLLGLVNQLQGTVYGESYSSFSKDAATNTVIMPLIMDRNSGFFTGINVMNVGTSNTTVTCTFTDTDYEISKSLDPGQALTELQYKKIADKYVGSGTCTTSDPSGKVVAVVNQLRIGFPDDDVFYVYEGISR